MPIVPENGRSFFLLEFCFVFHFATTNNAAISNLLYWVGRGRFFPRADSQALKAVVEYFTVSLENGF